MVVNSAPSQTPNADFNKNEVVDIGDTAKIAYYLVGKVTELECAHPFFPFSSSPVQEAPDNHKISVRHLCHSCRHAKRFSQIIISFLIGTRHPLRPFRTSPAETGCTTM
ncbi:MAG: hypothetical protein NTW33_02920 [Methanoregula sp.]|nr:hypothetical protein [Methanoregula sp.]